MKESFQAYLSLGANWGDRQGNLLQALQNIRAWGSIHTVSTCYEVIPTASLERPGSCYLACLFTTELPAVELHHNLKQVEKQIGRQVGRREALQPVEIEILLYGSQVLDAPGLTIPHPRLAEQACLLAPLAEIAAEAVHPLLKRSVTDLLQNLDTDGLRPLPGGLSIHLGKDMQQSAPETHISISRAGVTDLRRIVNITRGGQDNLFYAQIDLFADLDPRQMGVHMSRFGDVLEEIVDEIAVEKSPDIESLAERIAVKVVKKQEAIRAEVNIRAVYPMQKTAPLSGRKMQELYTILGIAVSNRQSCKRIIGVEAEGMTVCPCAQDMVRDYSRERLLEQGFTPEQAERALNAIPIASHNQRGRGTLLVGTDRSIRAEDLVRIIEGSMSSETYDVLKRPDELYVVNKAHRNPRFVEDVVREMLRNVVETYYDLPDSTFIQAKQINLESIHKHNAFAERYGTLGEIRGEIESNRYLNRHTTMEEWLGSSYGI